MVVLKNGNVGLGTSTPALTLDVSGQIRATTYGGGSAAAEIVASNTGAGIAWDQYANATDEKWWDILANGPMLEGRAINDANNAGTIWLQVNRGTGVAINSVSNGNVGIGTTNPATTLEVNGQIQIDGGSPQAGNVLPAMPTVWLPGKHLPVARVG